VANTLAAASNINKRAEIVRIPADTHRLKIFIGRHRLSVLCAEQKVEIWRAALRWQRKRLGR